MSVDGILDVIDAGLQTPVPDPTFGEISPKDEGGCLRCGDTWIDQGEDLCTGCRAFLLGDSDHDPSLVDFGGIDAESAMAGMAVVCDAAHQVTEQFVDRVNALAAAFGRMPDEVREMLAAAITADWSDVPHGGAE